MRIEADGFRFDFTDAIDAFVFDEKDRSKSTYHGLPMKAVDIVAEFETAYVFVEMKDFDDPEIYNEALTGDEQDVESKRKSFNWLKNYLKHKYRDSYLYRHAEQKVDKPIHYLCLLTFDNALNDRMQKALKLELPIGKASHRWQAEIANSCQVLNVDRWNRNFPKWPVQKILSKS
jgi:hypothetical protein